MSEKKTRYRRPTADEQQVLDKVRVELVRPEELAQCKALLEKQHYLHSAHLVGEQLYYVAVWQGQWLAIGAWCAAALHLQAHDRPKQVWVRELEKRACEHFRADPLPPAWAPVEARVPPHWTAKQAEIHILDVTMDEDRSRVGQPNAALVVGMLRRVAVSFGLAWREQRRADNPKARASVRSFQKSFHRRADGPERLQALIFTKEPVSWCLAA